MMGWDFTDTKGRYARIPIWAMWFYREAAEKYAPDVMEAWEYSAGVLEPGDAVELAAAFQQALDAGENIGDAHHSAVPAARIRTVIAFFQNCHEQYEVV